MAIELRQRSGNVKLAAQAQLIKGDDGGYYIPNVDADGNLTWTPSEEGMPAIEGANVKGETGPQGLPGKDGANGKDGKDGANGKDGVDGKDGVQGPQGEKGDKGDIGPVGPKGERGDSGVYVGTTEPTDTNDLIWINPDGEAATGLATEQYVDDAIAAALAGIATAEEGAY